VDNTGEFVAKVKDRQRKDAKNKQHQGEGNPGNELPGKQHSTNK
jgi:hypothetical protein